MNVPLNCSRVLGVPLAATPDDMQRALRDRILSMPRREFSETAIGQRKRLLEKAYQILVETPVAPDADSEFGPTVLATEQEGAGLLLLLYELGEYEQVISLSRPLVDQRQSDADIILSHSLAYLELGRQRWKQGHYEAAAQHLETVQELLQQEGLFISVRSEIQADLYRLRPYRILELLAAPDHHTAEHRRGLHLLQEMLEARRGIDGKGNDHSGLDIDEFLRFIHQLRGYMTTTEQQNLFEDEARRPSSVASYLAFFALVARGFSQRQPALIRRAKGLLVKLGLTQDVYLEQAICALLLGQTDEATSCLEKSAETPTIQQIQQHSEQSPDLLPGLCRHAAQWLEEEVYPHFRDLVHQSVSLTDYFADHQVQVYLDELPNSTLSSDWATTSRMPAFATTTPGVPTSLTPSALVPMGDGLSPMVPPRPLPERRTPLRVVSPPPEPTAPPPRERPATARAKRRPPWRRYAIVGIAAAVVLGGTSLAAWAVRSLMGNNGASRESLVSAERSLPILLSTLKQQPSTSPAVTGELTEAAALQVVQNWKQIQARVYGKDGDPTVLEKVLAEPRLGSVRQDLAESKSLESYVNYQLKDLTLVRFEKSAAEAVDVRVKIAESREYFTKGVLDHTEANSEYEVTYRLARQNDAWLIADWTVHD